MKEHEAIELLMLMVPFDQRTIGEGDATAWAALLEDIPFDQTCREAIVAYYRTAPVEGERRARMEPHHLRMYRKRIRDDRLARVPAPLMPNQVEGVDDRDELLAIRRAIGDGRMRSLADVKKYEEWGGSLHLADQRQLVSAGERKELT